MKSIFITSSTQTSVQFFLTSCQQYAIKCLQTLMWWKRCQDWTYFEGFYNCKGGPFLFRNMRYERFSVRREIRSSIIMTYMRLKSRSHSDDLQGIVSTQVANSFKSSGMFMFPDSIHYCIPAFLSSKWNCLIRYLTWFSPYRILGSVFSDFLEGRHFWFN